VVRRQFARELVLTSHGATGPDVIIFGFNIPPPVAANH
jgi:hypothetical protein